MKKYILTDETIEYDNRILHRIEAVKDFAFVKKGDKGGFIENEKNLSHLGDAWVGGNAKIYGNAQIYENAKVCGNAEIYGFAQVLGNVNVRENAKIYGSALVGGVAWIYGDAQVCGTTCILGDAQVLGNARIRSGNDMATVSNFGTENRLTTFFRGENGEILVKCGCFFGNLEEFREQVRKTRDGYFAEEYLMIADLMEMRFRNREDKTYILSCDIQIYHSGYPCKLDGKYEGCDVNEAL